MRIEDRKMELKYWAENTISDRLCNDGIQFIRSRFKEVWGITRNDVSYALLMKRINFTLFDGARLIGWLGIESDNEFTNACIENGYPGTSLLKMMLQEAIKSLPKDRYFAYVPISRTGSARAFVSNGFYLSPDSFVKQKKYPERSMELVHIERVPNDYLIVDAATINDQLDKIKELKNGAII